MKKNEGIIMENVGFSAVVIFLKCGEIDEGLRRMDVDGVNSDLGGLHLRHLKSAEKRRVKALLLKLARPLFDSLKWSVTIWFIGGKRKFISLKRFNFSSSTK